VSKERKECPSSKIDFWSLFIFLCKFNLTIKEIQSVLWRYGCHKEYRKIAVLLGGVTHQCAWLYVHNAKEKIKKRYHIENRRLSSIDKYLLVAGKSFLKS